MTGLLAQLLAPGLFGAELQDSGQPVPFHPDEEHLVASAAPTRRRDFALGRACAHSALAQLGLGDGPILKAPDGAPLWPAGLVGSITHTRGYAAALVARAPDCSGLGVDAERTGGVTPDLWPRLFCLPELDYLKAQPDRDRIATILFSAKEACFKAGDEAVLRFQDFRVSLAGSCFTAACRAQVFEGRFAAGSDLVVTAAWRARA